uniref:uncharacterized protein LOC122580523 n=1 Tax=Erigeron canadensis TaxID=72917 RepID=UPI001CB8EC8F|nr:uncharacterized protein LOC122580523 [Erigeron canadensis]
MGICISCHSNSLATGKLILPDGTLQEFSCAIKVSEILVKNPSTFICNADEMDFDDVVSPLKNNDMLQPGQLYFALPLKRLKHPLQPEEMAALAVTASDALAKSCGGGRKSKKNNNKMFLSASSSKVADFETVGATLKGGRGVGVGYGGKKQNFKVMLSVIPE